MTKPNYIIPSLERATELMKYLADHPGMSQHELARIFGYPPNSVFRILRTLQKQGLVHKEADSSKYVLGTELCVLGLKAANRFNLMDVAPPILGELAEHTRESIQMFTRHLGKALLIYQIESVEKVRISAQLGSLHELHSNAPGKVLLASISHEEFLATVRTQGLPRHTQHTICTIPALREEMERVRSQGYAVDMEEADLGIRCVAGPVRNYLGEVIVALNISGPLARMDEPAMVSHKRLVFETAARLSRAMGYDPTRTPEIESSHARL